MEISLKASEFWSRGYRESHYQGKGDNHNPTDTMGGLGPLPDNSGSLDHCLECFLKMPVWTS